MYTHYTQTTSVHIPHVYTVHTMQCIDTLYNDDESAPSFELFPAVM